MWNKLAKLAYPHKSKAYQGGVADAYKWWTTSLLLWAVAGLGTAWLFWKFG